MAMYSETTILVLSNGKSDGSHDLARLLADEFRVLEAEGPQDAASQLSEDAANLVVADLEAGGRALWLDLLRSGSIRHTPFLGVAAAGDVEAAVEAMKAGAADCIVKPLKRDALRASITRLLDPATANGLTRAAQGRSQVGSQIGIPPGTSLEELERAAVEQALAEHQGNRTHAAKTLGISVRTLQRKLKAWGMPYAHTSNSQRTSASPPSENNFVLQSHGGHSNYSTNVN